MMDALKELTIIMCGLMLIISVIETMLPERNLSPVIKWVVLLYTVSTLIGPITDINTGDLVDGFQISSSTQEIAEQQLLGGATEVLENNIYTTLEARGIRAGDISIELRQDESGLNVGTIYIEDIAAEDRSQVRETVEVLLDGIGDIVFK